MSERRTFPTVRTRREGEGARRGRRSERAGCSRPCGSQIAGMLDLTPSIAVIRVNSRLLRPEPRVSLTEFAWHGREQSSCPGSRPGLASFPVTSAFTVGRQQRSYAGTARNTPPPQGFHPCTPGIGTVRGPDVVVSSVQFGVQGQRPCGGGVPASARTSERCGLPSA